MGKSSFCENKRVLHILELLEREGIKRKDLALILEIEPQNLSRCLVNGKVSEKMCQKIIDHFPDYRIEWLLGYDDIMTHYDWADGISDRQDDIATGLWGMFEKSLNRNGKSLKFVHHSNQHLDSRERLKADCYYSVVDSKGKELKRLTASEMVTLEQKIQEYCDFIAQKYL